MTDRNDYHKFEGSIGRPSNQKKKRSIKLVLILKIMLAIAATAVVISVLHATSDCEVGVRCTDN